MDGNNQRFEIYERMNNTKTIKKIATVAYADISDSLQFSFISHGTWIEMGTEMTKNKCYPVSPFLFYHSTNKENPFVECDTKESK